VALDAPALENAAEAGIVARRSGGFVRPAADVRVERVVVRAPNWLGDVVLSLGAVRDVRRRFPKARLEVLARPSVAGLYGAVSEVDAVRTSVGTSADARALRGAFDLAVLLPNSFGSAYAVWRAGVPERWGYATDGRGLLLTRGAAVPAAVRGESQVYYYRAMLAAVGLQVSATPDTSLRCPDAWRERLEARLGTRRRIAMSPGAAFGGAKRWRPEGFAAAGDALARARDAEVVILGSAGDRPLGEAIAAQMTPPPRVLCGETTLPDLVAILAGAEILLTNDSGAMHVAAALGTPLVAVFGPTDWRETAPVGRRHRLVREPVHCAPCMLRDCPIDHRCMKAVSAERVVGAAREVLAS
jgi:heptosyltransferase-2